MTKWTPPRSDGLRHNALPHEQLAALADPDADVNGPGIYGLLLSTPDTDSVETHARLWREHHDAMPTEQNDGYGIETLASADRVVYVGAAKNVRSRVADHVAGKQTSAVMEVYPPHSVWDVWFCDSVGEAFERESGKAIALNNRYGDVHFHSR